MINKARKKASTVDSMKRLTHKMELLLMDCHERELLNQDPYDIATHFAKGLLKRKLLEARMFTNLDKDYEMYTTRGLPVNNVLQCFAAIESSIITLTSMDILQSCLNNIPSKDDLKF